ncbi:uncharacterized protein PV07_02205 [Cladophialophora immunda]|uniref:Uncharacterized protein n=1 Tax=Cladophialophora immunda TaxID=569365 RepID=A0A0D2DIM3_9EURO|nr:uncharacterized protein PV07_02205 [Cladophialophora immunda]KIW35514.1 hypothetical protein PV07_02205 [Cladophialophora immunda]OQV08545.1 hypothetical protein CLAIMM_12799 [Cladophialophora immunda]
MERNNDLILGYGKYQCLGKPVAFMELNKIFVEFVEKIRVRGPGSAEFVGYVLLLDAFAEGYVGYRENARGSLKIGIFDNALRRWYPLIVSSAPIAGMSAILFANDDSMTNNHSNEAAFYQNV